MTLAQLPWEQAAPGNVIGKVRTLTTLGEMPLDVMPRKKLEYLGRRVIGPPPVLERLSFIHYARTALVTRMPGTRQRLNPAYVYFESYFNQPFDHYIDAFAYIAASHLERIWTGAQGFNGPVPASRFKQFIRKHDYPAQHVYAAYPEATATEVQQGLLLRARMAALVAAARGGDAAAFLTGWQDAQRPPAADPLAPVRNAAEFFADRLRREDPNRATRGQAYALTVMTPIADGPALARALGQLPEPSPFGAPGGAHYARLVLIDRWPNDRRLPRHLLFSCVLDGEPEPFFDRLCVRAPDAVDAIWGPCRGAPRRPSRDPVAFGAWLLRHRITSSTFFAPYGEATVEQVRQALLLRENVWDFNCRFQRETASVVQREFRARYLDDRTWGLG